MLALGKQGQRLQKLSCSSEVTMAGSSGSREHNDQVRLVCYGRDQRLLSRAAHPRPVVL